jgi:para-nitrobenzyl esterase
MTSCDASASNLNRRHFILRGSMTLAAMVGASTQRSRLGLAQTTAPQYVEVKTACGRLRGLRQGDLLTFRGVPYAGSVSGLNRFKAAPPPESWTGVKDALQLGAPSWQPAKGYWGMNEPSPQEDCLFLNVWTPAADGRKRPVMFYSHGGGFYKGSGGAVYQDGGNLARTYDVVVVETNHRLGFLGYLFLANVAGEEYATSGNQGLLDLKDGLKWVHENIEAFGGDPNNVMIFGESGGALKTSCLYALPSAEKYFNKASIESGPGIRMAPRDVADRTTQMFLTELGLDRSQWRKLLEIPAVKLLAAQVAVGSRLAGPLNWDALRKGNGWTLNGGASPVVDGTVLPHDPFYPTAPAISKNKPLIVGGNRDETLFIWFQSKKNDVFALTEETLKERLHQEFGAEADTVLTTYRKSRPMASPPDLYTAITTACFLGGASITMAERKYAPARSTSLHVYIRS